MVIIEVICRYCLQAEPVRKHGMGRAGFPRYYCKNCSKSFQINYRYPAHHPGTKDKIIVMAINGSSARDTVRSLGVGINTVARTLKKSRSDK